MEVQYNGTYDHSLLSERVARLMDVHGDMTEFGNFSYMAWIKDDKLLGAYAFTNYADNNIYWHVSGKGILTRRKLKSMFNYVFLYLKCRTLTAICQIHKPEHRSYLKRMGFKFLYRLENHYGDKNHGLVYVLTRDKLPKWAS